MAHASISIGIFRTCWALIFMPPPSAKFTIIPSLCCPIFNDRVFGSPLDEGYALNSINGGPTEYHWAELLGYNQV